jgi:hypothetical protein
VVAIGVDASDKAAAEAKGPRMDLSVYVFDALHEDAALVLCRGATECVRARVLCLRRLDERAAVYILTSINGRPALASRGAVGTEVS